LDIELDGLNEYSAFTWGSTVIVEGVGYTIIIRYGNLYVLYGHLYQIEPTVYVGANVQKGMSLGNIGTSAPGADAHVHIEVRNFNTDDLTQFENALEKDASGNLNPYGLLYFRNPSQARYMYDLVQFYGPTGSFLDPDNLIDSGSGLNQALIRIEDTPPVFLRLPGYGIPLPAGCNLQYYTIPEIRETIPNSGYRGLELGRGPNEQSGASSSAKPPNSHPTLPQN
jgi:hypothetical protein